MSRAVLPPPNHLSLWRATRRKFLISCLAILTLLGCSVAMAIEEPGYEVLFKTPLYEVRRYVGYITAEVDVDGDFRAGGGDAFRILAGYIFGDNEPGEKMAMTAPVEARPGARMAMTAPVTSTRSDDDARATFAFVMEAKYSLATLPQPLDKRIRIVERTERVMAVHRYSGGWSQARYDKHEAILLDALAEDNVQMVSAPVFARYNAPFTPWFLRRNEVLVEVKLPPVAATD